MNRVIKLVLTEQFTEDQVQDMFEDVYAEFYQYKDELGFDDYYVSKIVGWLNSNNRKTLGRCTERNGRFTIQLNPNLLKFEEDGEKIIRETIAHELCHTLSGCMNHGRTFHAKAAKIMNLMGYHIDTKADIDSSQYFNKYLPQADYMLICDKCGNQVPVARLSDPIKNPMNYSCKLCGGNVSSYKLNKNTGELELYRSSEEKPDYKYAARCENCDYEYPWARKSQMFNKILHAIVNGGTVKCPKCRSNLYLVDSDKEIHSGDYR